MKTYSRCDALRLGSVLGLSVAILSSSAIMTSSTGAHAETMSSMASMVRATDCDGKAMASASAVLDPGSNVAPPDLATLTSDPPFKEDVEPGDLARLASVRQSALSLGMRAGFNRGIWCYQKEIERFAAKLDRIFNFAALSFEAGGGFMYEPGVVSEDFDARTVRDDGLRAASASDRVVLAARENLVTRSRNWRQYLILEIEPLAPEHPANRPKSSDRASWEGWLAEGWRRGLQQAADTMTENWALLDHDYIGMITYKRLMIEGKIERPKSYINTRGVTGNADEIRIDDTEVQTTKRSRLQPDRAKWNGDLPFLGTSR